MILFIIVSHLFLLYGIYYCKTKSLFIETKEELLEVGLMLCSLMLTAGPEICPEEHIRTYTCLCCVNLALPDLSWLVNRVAEACDWAEGRQREPRFPGLGSEKDEAVQQTVNVSVSLKSKPATFFSIMMLSGERVRQLKALADLPTDPRRTRV